ncbi:hypothetical protein [Phenylobacterium sp.]|uniref:hypothetical protein n=1 Tax=Phenylobacterium sp. TaxID=1871053 RepID=UPI00301B8B6B
MTNYTMPTRPGFRSADFYLETNTGIYQSPVNKAVQRMERSGALWQAVYTLPAMKRADAMVWKAFFLKLKGRVHTFSAYDPECAQPRGVATGTPLVKGAGQTGNTLLIDGCTASTFGWLMAGDYFSCEGQLHQLTQDADTNGSGETTLVFEPPRRSSPADNAAIVTDKPSCKMIMLDDSTGSWPSDAMGVYQEKTFTAMEVIS